MTSDHKLTSLIPPIPPLNTGPGIYTKLNWINPAATGEYPGWVAYSTAMAMASPVRLNNVTLFMILRTNLHRKVYVMI